MQRECVAGKKTNMVPRIFSFIAISAIISFAAVSIVAQAPTAQINVTCISCYQYQITYFNTVLGSQFCPVGTLCNATSMNSTFTSPCSASYSCGNSSVNSTVFGCPQAGKFASLTSCNEYNTCRLLYNGGIVLIAKKCPGRSLFNNVVKLCTRSSVISCGNVTYIPSTQ